MSDYRQSPVKHAPAGKLSFAGPGVQRAHTPKLRPTWQRISLALLHLAHNPKLIALVCLIGFLFLGVITIITYVVFANSLATPEALINRKNVGLIFYDKDGKEFYHTGEARDTTLIPMNEIPNELKEATVAIEDKDFYKHGGFSISSIFRAIWTNIQMGDPNYIGGSTITQQLVKNSLLTQKKSFIRKFQELVLSIEIDRRYSKEQILQLYLTSTFYGSGSFGVNEAAETYFAKPAKDLDIAQSALLAGIPQAPSAYSPLDGDADLAQQRQRQVLKVMKEQGYITDQEYQVAYDQKLNYEAGAAAQASTQAPHFVQYVTALIADEYGEDAMTRSGFKIYTTLDGSLQSKAQEVVAKRVAGLTKSGANNGALVAMDPTNGQILAMVGSADYDDDVAQGKYNWATEPQQPGSATKPFMYMTAFEEGYNPATVLHDVATDFNNYNPKNADGRFRGDVTARVALANSLNIPAVEMLQKVGVGDFVDTMRNVGLKSLQQNAVNQCGLAIVLGCAEVPLTELTHGFATLADEGSYHDMISYTKIVDKNGNQIYPTQSLFFDTNQNEGKQVVTPAFTYLISDILNDNSARSLIFGSNSTLKLSRSAAVKTGTTDDGVDAWAVGYTPQITVGVWVGNSANTPMTLAGATGAGPIWHEVMEAYLKGKPVKWYEQPDNVVKLLVCRGQEALADNEGDNTVSEYFIKNKLPKSHCNTTPTPSPTPSMTATPSATPTLLPTVTPTPTPSLTPTPSITPTLPGPTILSP